MSEHKQPKVAEGVVTSDAIIGRSHSLHAVKIVLLTGAVIVLVALGVFAYKIYIYDPAHKKSTQSLSPNSNEFLLNPDKQIAAAQTELHNAKSPKEKAVAYNDLGQAYLNNKQPSDALSAYSNSLSSDASTSNKISALNGLGYAYSRAGQSDKAIATFQQIISIIQASGNDSLKEQIYIYQSAISEIQQGQTL